MVEGQGKCMSWMWRDGEEGMHFGSVKRVCISAQ
jgi:hypothetical protein